MTRPIPINPRKLFIPADSATVRARIQTAILALLPLTAIALFLFYGFLMLPVFGFQTDEIIFIHALAHPQDAFAWFHYFGPSMLMSYLGALKSWLYAPIMALFGPTVWAVRTPVLLAATLTILLTGWFLRRISGWTAALIAVSLLATDATFQVTAVFDWGPVVLQNLLHIVGLILIVKWYREKKPALLFLAGFTFGLGLWNKALFLWNLSGMAVALIVVALPTIIRLWRVKCLIVFLIGICIGAAPLIVFNIKFPGITIQENAHSSLADVPHKAAYLRLALDGRLASTSLIFSQHAGLDRIHRPLQSVVLALAARTGNFQSNWRFIPGVLIICLGLIVARGAHRKWILFFLISGAIGWFESAITLNAGNSLHHTVLFWTDWYCAVALSTACLTWVHRQITVPVMGALIIILMVRGALSENLSYANMILFSPATAWTNAVQPLTKFLLQSGVKQAIITDWGITSVVSLRSNDHVTLHDESVALNTGVFPRELFSTCLPPSCVVVTHSPDQIIFPVAAETLDQSLRDIGLVKTAVTTIEDTHGFPVFSVFGLSPNR